MDVLLREGQDLLSLVFPYFLKLSLHISRMIKPSSAGLSKPGHSCIEVQGCPPETSWVSQTLLTVPPQASGWFRCPMRSRTRKHGVYSGCLNAPSAASPRMRLLVGSPSAGATKTPKSCPQVPSIQDAPKHLGPGHPRREIFAMVFNPT